MALVALNLYTRPSDVYDYVGTEGVDLRLDDHNRATGQTIQATATAATLTKNAVRTTLMSGNFS